ncbi:acetolactate synthase isozyme 1 small subunit [Leminorella grimontii]|uniref:acetolactate synthase n=1 Tax=Leminorella grimontii TaxID=82981 RepID=A0AAV5MY61_9GAMM|nr:acetolactate synthase small subunit [Leminorella grimontii]KFC96187.1 acetolactate synthase small subunit [Leminorella grimontii ATCC 33999 = DSM 5078]GKX54625.1 acetolactate synthase isozyme 1 small subunit [Leminorella grimontii]VFS58797.1 Acetolactate synthase isozyme 1 small subunit [Leminorella grimontii]
MSQINQAIALELIVRNHPGVMSHICGLFARRAFNVEGILCMPIKDSTQSRIWLLVQKDLRLSQMVSQVEKLEDVQAVNYSENLQIFEEMSRFMQ